MDTLEEYARRFPDAERFFLLGVDAFALLDQWRDAPRVVGLAHLAVLTRAGDQALDTDSVYERVRAIGGDDARMPQILDSRRIDVSSTEIRARVRDGRSIRGFVPDAVETYIAINGLYQ